MYLMNIYLYPQQLSYEVEILPETTVLWDWWLLFPCDVLDKRKLVEPTNAVWLVFKDEFIPFKLS